ncbi:MAG: thioredoxin fold domain-containing protein [Campylobacteraceae bacterium]|nr:thioredoxin fold domain-containing protein [Campylobacteraceae bacterium]
MKKIIILSLFLITSTLFSATNEEIIAHFKMQIPVPNIKIKVTSRKKVSDTLDYVSLFLTNGKESQKISVFTSKEYIFPDVIDVKSGVSLREKMQKKEINKKISKIYKKEKAKNIISLGDDPKKDTLVIFSDPECPFCKKDLANIENELKNFNIKMIFTPVHDKSSLEKSALIYKYVKNVKNTKDKIKILRKYFNQEVDEKVSDKEVQRIDKLRQKYFQAGINGTPYKVMEKDIKK